MPSVDGATKWIGGEVTQPDLITSPCLIYFWAVSCPACLYNMPNVERWQKEYASRGLRVVAIHRPRMPDDCDTQTVLHAIEEHGITGFCALDHENLISSRFETGDAWPYYFLFDGEGKLRSRAAGGVGLRLLGDAMQRMLARENKAVSTVA